MLMQRALSRIELVQINSVRVSWTAIFAVAGLLVRFGLIGLPKHGYDTFAYGHWTWRLVNEPLSTFYVNDGQAFPDHLPGDIWLLKLLGDATHFIFPSVDFYGTTYGLVRICFATGFDAISAIALYAIGISLGRRREGLIAAVAWWCAPASVFVSSGWGQIDGVSMAIALIALGLAINKRFSVAFIVLTLCTMVKPQYALLALPILIAWWRVRDGSMRRWSAHVAITAASCLALVSAISAPFHISLIGEWGQWSILSRLQEASDLYPVTSLGAHNIWILDSPFDWPADDRLPIFFGMSAQLIGYLLFAVVIAVALWILVRCWEGMLTMVLASNILLLGFFLFSTRMHERYMFPVVGLSLLLALMDVRFLRYAATIGVVVFTNIFLRFVWSLNDSYTGWQSFAWAKELQVPAVVYSCVGVTLICFVWLCWEGSRKSRPNTLDTHTDMPYHSGSRFGGEAQ